ncbi:MAG: hypothetical protein V1735_07485 [Nanoarchaeota archaeon]
MKTLIALIGMSILLTLAAAADSGCISYDTSISGDVFSDPGCSVTYPAYTDVNVTCYSDPEGQNLIEGDYQTLLGGQSHYEICFMRDQCAEGNYAMVCVNGCCSDLVQVPDTSQSQGEPDELVLNHCCDIAIPEFTIIGGGIALIGAITGLLILRRKSK